MFGLELSGGTPEGDRRTGKQGIGLLIMLKIRSCRSHINTAGKRKETYGQLVRINCVR